MSNLLNNLSIEDITNYHNLQFGRVYVQTKDHSFTASGKDWGEFITQSPPPKTPVIAPVETPEPVIEAIPAKAPKAVKIQPANFAPKMRAKRNKLKVS